MTKNNQLKQNKKLAVYSYFSTKDFKEIMSIIKDNYTLFTDERFTSDNGEDITEQLINCGKNATDLYNLIHNVNLKEKDIKESIAPSYKKYMANCDGEISCGIFVIANGSHYRVFHVEEERIDGVISIEVYAYITFDFIYNHDKGILQLNVIDKSSNHSM